jgi:hypothetical protein
MGQDLESFTYLSHKSQEEAIKIYPEMVIS